MGDVDIFNGDADGICALVQLRQFDPRSARLITGMKRDIALVNRANVRRGDRITILDVSFDRNRDGVLEAIESGASIFYCDHHFSGDLPSHPALQTLINTSSGVCTSVLINGYLKSRYSAWAAVGAFGDNLSDTACEILKSLSYKKSQLDLLKKLGIYMNYNSYGMDISDLNLHPADLYRALASFESPLDFVSESPEYFQKLETSYHSDFEKVLSIVPQYTDSKVAVYFLPNKSWSRRISGMFSNQLANEAPSRAHAVLTERNEGDFLVSVRAPINNRKGADILCRQFLTGGGRSAAAGIDHLPAEDVDKFIQKFSLAYC